MVPCTLAIFYTTIFVFFFPAQLHYITLLFLNLLKPSGSLRTTRFNIQKFYMALALR
jgi:hypothetical protein